MDNLNHVPKTLRPSSRTAFLIIDNSAPHNGQSSQLVFEAINRNAQFLATVAIGVLNRKKSIKIRTADKSAVGDAEDRLSDRRPTWLLPQSTKGLCNFETPA